MMTNDKDITGIPMRLIGRWSMVGCASFLVFFCLFVSRPFSLWMEYIPVAQAREGQHIMLMCRPQVASDCTDFKDISLTLHNGKEIPAKRWKMESFQYGSRMHIYLNEEDVASEIVRIKVKRRLSLYTLLTGNSSNHTPDERNP